MTTTKSNQQPWLDPNGKVYSDAALKQISKTWDAKTWDKYLSEQSDKYLREESTDQRSYDFKCEKESMHVWNTQTGFPSDHPMAVQIRSKLKRLTKQQQQIIRCMFWQDLSLRETAATLGISATQVLVQKRRSLKRLKQLLEGAVRTFRMSEGTVNSNPQQTIEEQIYEVYQSDLQGSYIK